MFDFHCERTINFQLSCLIFKQYRMIMLLNAQRLINLSEERQTAMFSVCMRPGEHQPNGSCVQLRTVSRGSYGAQDRKVLFQIWHTAAESGKMSLPATLKILIHYNNLRWKYSFGIIYYFGTALHIFYRMLWFIAQTRKSLTCDQYDLGSYIINQSDELWWWHTIIRSTKNVSNYGHDQEFTSNGKESRQ